MFEVKEKELAESQILRGTREKGDNKKPWEELESKGEVSLEKQT